MFTFLRNYQPFQPLPPLPEKEKRPRKNLMRSRGRRNKEFLSLRLLVNQERFTFFAFFSFRKILIYFTSILTFFVFVFFRKILIPFVSLFLKLFFVFFYNTQLAFFYIQEKKILKKYVIIFYKF